jgi:multiple antibiotic resistance protein
MLDVFVPAFVTLFVVIDPPGCAPIFASLTQGASDRHRKAMAWRAVGVATLILLGFAFGGRPLLSALGISLDAFRIAGGVLLFLIAIDMVFEKRTQRREHRAEQVTQEAQRNQLTPDQEDISVFPMALPMIAGPGSIGTIMLLMAKQNNEWPGQLVILSALAANLLLTLIALLAASWLVRLMGRTVAAAITRLLGVILAALAAQLIVDGIRALFPGAA